MKARHLCAVAVCLALSASSAAEPAGKYTKLRMQPMVKQPGKR